MNQIPQLAELKDNKTIVFKIQNLLSKSVEKEFGIKLELQEIEVNTTVDEKLGDYTSNVSLKLSKQLGKNPREIGEFIKQSLEAEEIKKIEIAGPGFINFYLNENYYLNNLAQILDQGEKYGLWELGANKQVMVEFGQPNTHKAFHVGHLKSAFTGLAIAKLIRNLGFEVIQANFFGDIGMHVAKCTWGFIQKGTPEGYGTLDAQARMKYLDECYVYGANQFKENPEAEREIREINKKIYDRSDENINVVYLQTREWSLEHQSEVFKKLGVIYDRQYPESEVFEEALRVVTENTGKVFIEDQGAIIFPGESYGLNNWVFITKEGNPTYSAKDSGLAKKKFEEFPDLDFSIVTTSVEQTDYFKAVIKSLELIDDKFTNRYFHLGFGWLLRNNRKTSSRMGNNIKGIDVINEATEFSLKKIAETKEYSKEQSLMISEKVAVAGLKFLILSHEIHKDINYDPEQFLNPEGFSGPYILYGYVRAKSILRQRTKSKEQRTKNKEQRTENREQRTKKVLSQELSLLQLLEKFPNVTFDAGKTLSPHKLCNYLFELTQEFNQFYRENKVLVDDEKVRDFRLALTEAVGIVLKNGLELLGIETIEEM